MTDANGMTSLHIAASKGHLESCEVLLDYGNNLDLNALDDRCRTPLHLACIHSHLQVAQLLTRSGALLNEADIYGNTPLHYVISSGDIDFIN